MLNGKINELREILNNLSNTEDLGNTNIINISHEMDDLIIEYYNFRKKNLQKKVTKKNVIKSCRL